METNATILTMKTETNQSKGMVWTGRIISILVILFLLMDAIMKIIKEEHSMKGSAEVGWPADAVQSIGIVLLIATILYAIPRTAVLGAILLTGYLGGAVAVMIIANMPGHPYAFPVVIGILMWAGRFLQDEKLRALIPFRRS